MNIQEAALNIKLKTLAKKLAGMKDPAVKKIISSLESGIVPVKDIKKLRGSVQDDVVMKMAEVLGPDETNKALGEEYMNESTKEYGKSLDRIADKEKHAGISSSDKDKLGRIADMMRKEREAKKNQEARLKNKKVVSKHKFAHSKPVKEEIENVVENLQAQMKERKLKNLRLKAKQGDKKAAKEVEKLEQELGMLSKEKEKAKGRTYVSDVEKGETNIIMQLRSAQDLGGNKILQFRRGTGKASKADIDFILKLHDALNPEGRRRLRIMVGQSQADLVKVVNQYKGRLKEDIERDLRVLDTLTELLKIDPKSEKRKKKGEEDDDMDDEDDDMVDEAKNTKPQKPADKKKPTEKKKPYGYGGITMGDVNKFLWDQIKDGKVKTEQLEVDEEKVPESEIRRQLQVHGFSSRNLSALAKKMKYKGRPVRYDAKTDSLIAEATRAGGVMGTTNRKVIDSFKTPTGDEWVYDEVKTPLGSVFRQITKTAQGGKSLKNQYGGYSAHNTGDVKYTERKWKDLKKKYVSEETVEEGYKVGDFVKHRNEIYRVFRVDGNTLHVGKHRGKNSYGGSDMIHASKVTKASKPSDVTEEVYIDEVLKPSDPIAKWIDDFVNSDNPKFEGKSKDKRIEMAKGAWYAAQKGDN